MFGLSFIEIVVVLCVALIVLGPDKLPEAARTIGRFVGMFRRTLDEVKHEFNAPNFNNEFKKAVDEFSKLESSLSSTAPKIQEENKEQKPE